MTGAYLVSALIFFSLLYAVQLYFNKNIWLKIVNVTVLVIISSAVYFTFETYKGWPTIERQHDKARVLGVIIEPPIRGKSDGAIYYWVQEKKREDSLFNQIFRYESPFPNSPRSYHLPYSKEAEKRFSEAQQAIQDGNIVMMDPAQTADEGDGKGDKPGQGKKSDAKDKESDGQEQNYDVPTLEIITPDQFMGKVKQ